MFGNGNRIGNYEIVSLLRTGGMGALYLARRIGVAGFSRHVVIKVIHQHLASDSSFLKSFINEALLSARISHPNVVHVEELGEANGTYFLAMEHVDGCSLSQFLRRLKREGVGLSPAYAVSIATKVAVGLHAAHETRDDAGIPLGLVHRDISPQNVLLSYNGHIKLIDFGIAKAQALEGQTATGSLKGKLRYMSPEQASGKPIDLRTDVYALGIVLWEMLTGLRFFEKGEDLAVLDKVRDPDPQPPGNYAADIPEALDRAVLKALAVNPKDRPKNALELRSLLLDALPKAASIDAARLSSLLKEVFEDELKKRNATEEPPPKESSRPSNIGLVLDDQNDLRTSRAARAYEALEPTPALGVRPPPTPAADEPSLATHTDYRSLLVEPSLASSKVRTESNVSSLVSAVEARFFRWVIGLGTAGALGIGALILVLLRTGPTPSVDPQNTPATIQAHAPTTAPQEDAAEPKTPAPHTPQKNTTPAEKPKPTTAKNPTPPPKAPRKHRVTHTKNAPRGRPKPKSIAPKGQKEAENAPPPTRNRGVTRKTGLPFIEDIDF